MSSGYRGSRAFDDLRIEPVARLSGTGVPDYELWFTTGSSAKGVYLYSFTDESVASNEKSLNFTMQMPHSWVSTTGSSAEVHVHVHWIPSAGMTGAYVQWGLDYTWAEPSAVFGNTVIIYSRITEQGDTTLVANKHYITELPVLYPNTSQDGLSSIIIGRIFRNSSSALDNYTGKCGMLFIDAHIQLDTNGSISEYVK